MFLKVLFSKIGGFLIIAEEPSDVNLVDDVSLTDWLVVAGYKCIITNKKDARQVS
jgi:hypothetical protein